MKITRDGKVYDLTSAEIAMAWEEHQYGIWRRGIEDAIERNSESLRFGTVFTMDDFIGECMEEFHITEDIYTYAEEKNYDGVVFDVAELNEIWVNDPDEEDDEDEV